MGRYKKVVFNFTPYCTKKVRFFSENSVLGISEFETYEAEFAKKGTYISTALSAGKKVNWKNLIWAGKVSEETEVEFYISTSHDRKKWSLWKKLFSKKKSYVLSGMAEPSKYIRYKVKMKTDNKKVTPDIYNVGISYEIKKEMKLPGLRPGDTKRRGII